MSDPGVILTADGRARQERILRLAQAAGARRRRWRRAWQATPLLLVAAVLWWRHEPGTVPPQQLPVVQVPSQEVQISWIATDSTLAGQWAVPSGEVDWTSVTDDQLLDTAAQAGAPLALTYQNGAARAIALK